MSDHPQPHNMAAVILDRSHPYKVTLRTVNGNHQVLEVKQGFTSWDLHLPASGIDAFLRAVEVVAQIDSDTVEVAP